MIGRIHFAGLIFALGAWAATVESPPKMRLADNARPLRYAVTLRLTPPSDTFEGTIDIDVSLRAPASTIWMHGTNLAVREAAIRSGGKSVPARAVSEGRDFLGFVPDSPMAPGEATIHVVYEGRLSKKSSDGLFLNKAGSDWYLFSQFEPVSARQAFPCFDEPSFKVPWQLTLEVPKDDKAFANTPVISESGGPGYTKIVRFAETKPLPAYLIALAVGPFDIVDGGRAGRNKVPIRIVVPRGRSSDARYAAEVTGNILNRLEKYFGIPYPYEKLDSVAIPLAFGFGAMENAGLITYAQELLLQSRSGPSLQFQRSYTVVAAHEIAHQWFGDLVTLAWWDDTWLNEAFATWMEQKIAAELHPEWEIPISNAESAQHAMAQDSLVSARKIRQAIVSNSDIANAFDDITYSKGAAVIGMFETYVGAEKFQRGVKNYVDSHAQGSATAADFLEAVSAVAKEDIAPAFFSFLDQAGVPLVSMALDCSSKPSLALEQKRYLPAGSPGSTPQRWQIPVCVKFGDGSSTSRACTLLASEKVEMPLPAKNCPGWVLGNADEEGYYHVLYRGDLADRLLSPEIADRKLTTAERVGMLGDVQALVSGGQLPVAVALTAVPRFAKDPARQVVSSTLGIAALAGDKWLAPDLRPNFERFIRQVYSPRAHELGWLPGEDESENVRLLRTSFVPIVARRGHDEVLLREARRLAEKWLNNRSAIPPDLVRPVLGAAAEYGDRALWERFYQAAKSAKDFDDRRRLIAALGEFRSPDRVRTALDLILGTDFDARETFGLLFAPLRYPETREIPFEFVKQNYEALLQKLPRGIGADSGARLPAVGEAFCDEPHRQAVKTFFEPRVAELSGAPRRLAQVLESIHLCDAARQLQSPGVAEFLKKY